ncbi:MAG: ATP-dependent helicase HrpB [Proteobacteria bacterium]|nr:ATP-dependent helicase HrpB [Pseudomonadota bacterium]
MSKRAPFPIVAVLPDIRASLAAHPRLVLEAPPGAGKTTQVPPALLDAEWLPGKKVLVLEPRRIAARAAAEFMAAQRGESVGDTIGYRIRFESRVSTRTRVEVVTEGILTRLIQSDPELPGVGAIVFDEFHERHLHGDLGAALALDVQAQLRPELRLVIMSATLDGERTARWFDAPRITSAGRSFPVRVEYPPAKANEDWTVHLRRVADIALRETEGDVLVFLPGRREIEQARRTLEGNAQPEVVMLHGELSLAEQHAALAPAAAGTRRIVLATNVAESSVTLPGIRVVIDSGEAREPRFDPNSGFSRLQTVAISQASADQRAGRAGRVAEGVAYRLWPQSQRLEPSRRAEIAQVELSALALELAAWGAPDLRWLDPPPAGSLASARDLLILLGALDDGGRMTELGQRMLATGAAPRLAALALRTPSAQHALACDAIALLEARNPLRGEDGRGDDFRDRHKTLLAWRNKQRGSGIDSGAMSAIDHAAVNWRRRLRIDSSSPAAVDALALGNLLVHAFPDRVALQDAGDPRRYRLSNGRGAHLLQSSQLYGERWLVVTDLRFDERDSAILAAAPFDADMLERDFGERFVEQRVARWNADRRAVETFIERRFAKLVLERRSVPAKVEDALPALLAAVREAGIESLPWSDAARALRLRVACLREWLPELALPDLSDAALLSALEEWLGPHLAGKTRLDALTPAMLGEALASRLDYAQRKAVDELAPESITVPSGNSRKLHYEPGKPPVLAVKLQELFGLADTPRIAGGKIAVTLHLLSPAQRPIQVTQDLRGFWERTYPEVKKELKGRYPRHPWPDDPWCARPTARTKPRHT